MECTRNCQVGIDVMSYALKQEPITNANSSCIGCGICVSACTMVAHDPRFPGPAALNRLFTLQNDSRDAAHAARAAVALAEDALLRCHGQANCTAVCPMEISPTGSILALRRQAVGRLFR